MMLAACGRLAFDPLANPPGGGDGGLGDGRAGDGSPSTAPYEGTSSTTVLGQSSLSWPHTTAGGGLLFVFVATRASGVAPPTVTSVSYAGKPGALVVADCANCAVGGINDLELWVVTATPAGTADVMVTLTGAAAGASGIAISYLNATAVEGSAHQNSMTATPRVDVLVFSSPWVVAGAMDQGGYALEMMPAANQTARMDTVCDSSQYEGQTVADLSGASGFVTFTWSITGKGNGSNCITMMPNTARAWIAVGASFY